MKILSVGSEQGFTLVELLVTLAILALVLAVVPPVLSGAMDGIRFSSAERDLVSALRYARSRAVNLQQTVTVDINVKHGTMQVAGRQRDLSIPDDTSLTLRTARQEQLSEHAGAIRFYPDGSSTGGQVRLRRGDRVSSVDVNWLTGWISLGGQ